jgi:hypothetical protein
MREHQAAGGPRWLRLRWSCTLKLRHVLRLVLGVPHSATFCFLGGRAPPAPAHCSDRVGLWVGHDVLDAALRACTCLYVRRYSTHLQITVCSGSIVLLMRRCKIWFVIVPPVPTSLRNSVRLYRVCRLSLIIAGAEASPVVADTPLDI